MSIDMTTVGTTQAALLPGTDLDPTSPTDTYNNESATVIEPGAPVALGTGTTQAGGYDKYCMPVAADGNNILGPTVRRALVSTDGTTAAYARYATVPVKRSGRVAVLAAEDVRAGDEVIVLTATPGTFASSKGGAVTTGRVAMKGWKWETTTASGAIGIIVGFDTHTGRTTT